MSSPQHRHQYRSPSKHGVLTFSTIAPPLLEDRKFVLAVAAVMVFSVVCLGMQGTESPSAASHIVIIKQMQFDPPQITVQAGDTVEWKNEDIFAHTVTADDGSFDSGLIDRGHSWQMTVTTAQTLAYHCRPHPNMKATLIVSGAGEPGTHAGGHGAQAQRSAATLKWLPPRTPEEFHPILVNFTAALLPLALLSDILGRIFRRQTFHHAAWWMVLYAAVITPFTAAAGWWWKLTEGSALPPRLITVHQWLGSAAVVLFVVLAVWRWSIHKRDASPSLAYLGFAVILVIALVYQGSLGGRMVFGQ